MSRWHGVPTVAGVKPLLVFVAFLCLTWPVPRALACHQTIQGRPACPTLAVRADEQIYVVYISRTPRDIFFTRSLDGGQTWSTPVDLSANPGDSVRPTIALTAEGIIYGAFDIIQTRFKEDPLEVFRKALDNIKPKLEVKSRRVGGATYQVPVEVRPERRVALAMRWLVIYSRDRGEKTMRERLAAELVDAAQLRGNAVKKKDDTHKMADANKAFAHYRW